MINQGIDAVLPCFRPRSFSRPINLWQNQLLQFRS